MASRAVMTALKVGVGLAVTYKAYTTMSSYAQEKHSQLLDAKQRRPKPSGLFKDRYFENQHGLWLFKRRWSCKGRRKGSVYLVHGYGEVHNATHTRALDNSSGLSHTAMCCVAALWSLPPCGSTLCRVWLGCVCHGSSRYTCNHQAAAATPRSHPKCWL